MSDRNLSSSSSSRSRATTSILSSDSSTITLTDSSSRAGVQAKEKKKKWRKGKFIARKPKTILIPSGDISNYADVGADSPGVITVRAIAASPDDLDKEREVLICYKAHGLVGNGSNGIVLAATHVITKEAFAIKKVLQRPHIKYRELSIMRRISHPNLLRLLYYFYTFSVSEDQPITILGLVTNLMPTNLYNLARYTKLQPMSIKIYLYQILRGLLYLHALGVVHLDIKPHNCLVDPATHELQLCDFGNSKPLFPHSLNTTYVGTRFYRAPELIFGNRNYTHRVDIWSVGCLMLELFTHKVLFEGRSNEDQMVAIMKVLGTPTQKQLHDINPIYSKLLFPTVVDPTGLEPIFPKNSAPATIKFASALLEYSPKRRLSSKGALASEYFHELRLAPVLPKGLQNLPGLFNFSNLEMKTEPVYNSLILPPWLQGETPPKTNAPVKPTANPPSNYRPKILNLTKGEQQIVNRRCANLAGVFEKTNTKLVEKVNQKLLDHIHENFYFDEYGRRDLKEFNKKLFTHIHESITQPEAQTESIGNGDGNETGDLVHRPSASKSHGEDSSQSGGVDGKIAAGDISDTDEEKQTLVVRRIRPKRKKSGKVPTEPPPPKIKREPRKWLEQ